jgi:hypothetical protein
VWVEDGGKVGEKLFGESDAVPIVFAIRVQPHREVLRFGLNEIARPVYGVTTARDRSDTGAQR